MIRSFVIVLACAALLPGCTRRSAPTLSVTEVRLIDERPEGMVLEFDLAAENRNDIDLPLREVQYSLQIDGTTVFRGSRSAEATLRRFGTQTVTLPAVIDLRQHERPRGTRDYRLAGTLTYLTPDEIAEILYESRVYRPKVEFAERGRIDFDAADAPLNELSQR